MKKRIITLAGLMALSCALAVGCGNSTSQTETQSAAQAAEREALRHASRTE